MISPSKVKGMNSLVLLNSRYWAYGIFCCLYEIAAISEDHGIDPRQLRSHDPEEKFVKSGTLVKKGERYFFYKNFFEKQEKMKGNARAKINIDFNNENKNEINQDSILNQNCIQYCNQSEINIDSVLISKNKINKNTDTGAADLIFEIWNLGAPRFGFAKVTLSGKAYADRKKKLLVALKDIPNPEDWRKIFNQASTKGFSKNDGSTWTPNWDYVFRNNNYQKLLEEFEAKAAVPQSTDPTNEFWKLARENAN